MQKLLYRVSVCSGVPLLLAAGLWVGGCNKSPSPALKEASKSAAPNAGTPVYGCTSNGGELQILFPPFPPNAPPMVCPVFPNTTPTMQPKWDYFAWNSFIAANWPALDPASNSNQRGFPDLTKNFATAQPGDLLVWETFKEKRELFQPFYDSPTNTYTEQSAVDPGPWNQAVMYGPLDKSTQKPYDFPACTSSKTQVSQAQLRTVRRLPQLGKLAMDGNGSTASDSLDETVEVASEALESPGDLCKGYTTNPCGPPGTPPDCSCIQGHMVGPRVWKGSPTQANPQPVYYEVKLNYDYYNYVESNGYWKDSIAQTTAQNGQLTLPYRTSAKQGPSATVPSHPASSRSSSPSPVAVTGYSVNGCVKIDRTVNSTSKVTPCLAGSIQVKAAWIPLTHGEDKTKYHTATAAVYRTQQDPDPKKPPFICLDYDSTVTYGLVGIHIIQRIHQGYYGGNASPVGGTYIFATWEHVDNDKAHFHYADYLPPQVAKNINPPNTPPTSPPAGFYPTESNALPVSRKFQILPDTQAVNETAWKAIKKINPNSVWLNYRLIGTQFMPINLPTEKPAVPPFPTTLPPSDPTNIHQPTYLANLVIETNNDLQLFRGLPPSVKPISRFPPISGNSTTSYARDQANLAFGPKGGQTPQAFNMGGCMGCHGVSEVKGFSFSFVLLEGQLGADVDTEDDFNVPPLPPPTPGTPQPSRLPPKVHKREPARKAGP
jgi:hypothetical protein